MGSTHYYEPGQYIEHYDDELFKRTLYVGNLAANTSEYVIREIFSVLGSIADVKMITHEGQADQAPYCFVTYEEHEKALLALTAMNGRAILNREMRVNWATRPDGIRKDTSKDHHIFVGDLAHEVTTNELRKHFDKFGEVSEARVVRDSQTNRSKGYGFVAFVNKTDAERAIREMNKAILAGREIRTNWATSKRLPQTQVSDPKAVAKAASEYNTTVYCGGLEKTKVNERLLRETFSKFGPIDEIRLFDDKGYGFIKFQTHDAATQAICTMTGTSVNGCQLKCRWGKDEHKTGDMNQLTMKLDGLYPMQYQPYQQFQQPYSPQQPVQYYYQVTQQQSFYPPQQAWSNGENKEN